MDFSSLSFYSYVCWIFVKNRLEQVFLPSNIHNFFMFYLDCLHYLQFRFHLRKRCFKYCNNRLSLWISTVCAHKINTIKTIIFSFSSVLLSAMTTRKRNEWFWFNTNRDAIIEYRNGLMWLHDSHRVAYVVLLLLIRATFPTTKLWAPLFMWRPTPCAVTIFSSYISFYIRVMAALFRMCTPHTRTHTLEFWAELNGLDLLNLIMIWL